MGEAEQGQSAPVTEQQQVEKQAPETPASKDEQTPKGAEGAASEAGQSEKAEEADWQKQLDELYEKAGKDFRKHPKVAGLVGELAARQAKRDTETALAIERKRAEDERLEGLRKTNELAWAREKSRIEDAAKSEASEWAEFMAVNSTRYNSLPEEAKVALSGRDYGRNLAQAKTAYLTDLLSAEADSKAQTAVQKLLEKEREAAREAGRKEALATKASGEHVPDLSAGGAAGADLDQAEWDKNRANREWRAANRDRVERAVARGRVRY